MPQRGLCARCAVIGDRRDQRAYLRPVNNGVYKAGFATNQEVYESAVRALFGTLEEPELRLSRQRANLVGDRITEADWRLFATRIRFDPFTTVISGATSGGWWTTRISEVLPASYLNGRV